MTTIPPFPHDLDLELQPEHIAQVSIKNFRAIASLDFIFSKRLVLFVGDNQAGKTTVLKAIATAVGLFSRARFLERDLVEDARRTSDGVYEPELAVRIRNGENPPSAIERLLSNGKWAHDVPATYFEAERRLKDLIGDFSKWFSERDTEEAKSIRELQNLQYRHPVLEVIRTVVRSLVPLAVNIRTTGVKSELVVDVDAPDGQASVFVVEDLSGGVRTFLAMVVGIARMLIDWDPKLGINGPGMIFIDEIDLHLHPKWQQTVLPELLRTFPKTQFFVTTHSEQVISSVPSECVIALSRGPEGVVARSLPSVEGATADRVLEDVMGVPRRPEVMQRLLDAYIALVDDGLGESEEALTLRGWLDARLGNHDPDLVVADLEIRRLRAARQRVTP